MVIQSFVKKRRWRDNDRKIKVIRRYEVKLSSIR